MLFVNSTFAWTRHQEVSPDGKNEASQARAGTQLLHIRKAMGLSQNQMISKIGLVGDLLREEISDFERNKRIPPLDVILKYARAANVSVEALIDDELELPKKVPADPKSEGIRKNQSRRGKLTNVK